jgi:hypothetical protein
LQEEKIDLNPKQELFCQLYVSREFFANGTQAYIEAYDIDIKKPGAYNGARASASIALTNTNILKRINQILELEGLNDAFVDKQLTLLITQNADLGAKASGIREYNKLKTRITDKVDMTSAGLPINVVSYRKKDE